MKDMNEQQQLENKEKLEEVRETLQQAKAERDA